MPRGDVYVSGFFPLGTPKTQVRLKVVSQLEATNLDSALLADAADLYYSAWVSFIDALRGIQCQCCTWATVKLYYSTFYTLRAALALGKICTFHVGDSSFFIKALPGKTPFSCTDRGTHKTVMNIFQRERPAHALVSQQIDLRNPLDWLIAKREAVNYRDARFSEPDVLPEFDFVSLHGLRKALSTYLSDTTSLYLFDPDHAMVAYPLKALQMVGDEMLLASLDPSLSKEEQTFLQSHASDKSGSFAALVREMRRLKLLK